MRHNENYEERAAHRRTRYAQEDVNGRLIFALRDISHTMRGLYEGRGSQKRVLMVLSEKGTITQRELTEHLGIQPGSASEVIAKLEHAGLVVRTPSQADRRTADLSLTQAGQERAEEAKSQRVQRHIEMFSALSSEEKEQLLALLEKINADWDERYAPRQEDHGHHHPHHHEKGHGSHSQRDPHSHFDPEGHREEGHRDCNHDCANCPHPCGKSRARKEKNP